MRKKAFVLISIILISIIFLAIMLIVGINKTKNIPGPSDNNLSKYGPGDYNFSLKHDGLTRRYAVHAPSSYNKNTATALIINLHGGTGNPEAAARYSAMNDKSDSEGFIVVYPEGTGPKIGGITLGLWNAGRCCGPVQEARDNIDDIGFLNKMLDDLETRLNIDTKRIYATGLSNGGLISFRMACEMSDRIAAIAPIDGHDSFDSCNPVRPVSVMYFHGIDDPCVNYDGGICGGCFAELNNKEAESLWDCASVPDYINEWKVINGCSGNGNIVYKNGGATCVSYSNCNDGSEVVLCSIDGGGHTWPGGEWAPRYCLTAPNGKRCKDYQNTVGPITYDISANDMMWEFFKRHPMD